MLPATMTKIDLVKAVYQKFGGSITNPEAAELVDTVLNTLKRTLISEEKVKISGFGKFVVTEKKERSGRNPQNGDKIVIAERRIIVFKASQLLKEKLNQIESSH
jgi:integration host factor subunit alpha